LQLEWFCFFAFQLEFVRLLAFVVGHVGVIVSARNDYARVNFELGIESIPFRPLLAWKVKNVKKTLGIVPTIRVAATLITGRRL
jgi:hypothetical protein